MSVQGPGVQPTNVLIASSFLRNTAEFNRRSLLRKYLLMPRLSHVVLTLSAALAVPMAFAIAGAQVDESRISSTLVVDAANQSASDANPGTQSLPFKTIAHAAQVAMANSSAGVATKIL